MITFNLPSHLDAILAIFFAAGAIKGVLGMGLPTVAMGLLSLVMPVSSAAALLTMPSLVTNVWQMATGLSLRATVRRLWLMQLGIVAGVVAAPLLFPAVPATLGHRLLGGCLLAYGALAIMRREPMHLSARHELVLGLIAGGMTGLITGLTGVFVLPAVPYLQALSLGKEALSQALGLCFTTSTLALAAVLALQGHVDAQASLTSSLLVLPALAGMWLGQTIRRFMSETLFRHSFFTGLMLLGSWLLLR